MDRHRPLLQPTAYHQLLHLLSFQAALSLHQALPNLLHQVNLLPVDLGSHLRMGALHRSTAAYQHVQEAQPGPPVSHNGLHLVPLLVSLLVRTAMLIQSSPNDHLAQAILTQYLPRWMTSSQTSRAPLRHNQLLRRRAKRRKISIWCSLTRISVRRKR